MQREFRGEKPTTERKRIQARRRADKKAVVRLLR
jgi:hypothetical protein